MFGDGNPNATYDDERWKQVGFDMFCCHTPSIQQKSHILPYIDCFLIAQAHAPGMFLQAGQFIQSKGGVVTAEQLAPYLDVTPDAMERMDGSVSESYMVRAATAQ